MHAWRPGFMAFLAAAWIAPAAFAQATSSYPPADFGGERWSALSPDLDCGQMKERVDAILSSNSTYKDPVTGGGANLNNSGITAHTVAARREIAAGDAACSAGDVDLARPRYQRAMDELTATR